MEHQAKSSDPAKAQEAKDAKEAYRNAEPEEKASMWARCLAEPTLKWVPSSRSVKKQETVEERKVIDDWLTERQPKFCKVFLNRWVVEAQF